MPLHIKLKQLECNVKISVFVILRSSQNYGM